MKKNKTVSKKEKKVKEEKLEEEIKKTEKEIAKKEITEREEIKEFLISTETKAPVLERIITREFPAQNQFETQQKKAEKRRIDYSVSNEPGYSAQITEQQEKKYETTFIPPVLAQRETFSGREEFFRPVKSAWGEAKQISETPQQFGAFEMTRKKLPFEFRRNDNLVFSSKTIPVPINIKNKGDMDNRFKKSGVRIFDEVHVSGHGGRADIRNLIELLNPENVIPSHGDLVKTSPMAELAKELGYKMGKSVHLFENSQKILLR